MTWLVMSWLSEMKHLSCQLSLAQMIKDYSAIITMNLNLNTLKLGLLKFKKLSLIILTVLSRA